MSAYGSNAYGATSAPGDGRARIAQALMNIQYPPPRQPGMAPVSATSPSGAGAYPPALGFPPSAPPSMGPPPMSASPQQPQMPMPGMPPGMSPAMRPELPPGGPIPSPTGPANVPGTGMTPEFNGMPRY